MFYSPPNPVFEDKHLVISDLLKVAFDPILDLKQSELFETGHYVTREPLDRVGQAHYIAFSDPKSKSNGVDQIWTALNQTSKATYFLHTEVTKEKKGDPSEAHVFYPTIVLDGPLYLYDIAQEGKTMVRETQYVKFSHDVLTTKSGLEFFLIDIVTKNFLTTYIQWLDQEAKLLAGLDSN